MYLGEHRVPKSVELHNAWVRWDEFRDGPFSCASADGRFTISHLPEAALLPVAVKRCLLVTADGYVTAEAGPVVSTREPVASQLTIRLQRGKKIRGVVTDSESGQPIQGASVTYFNETQPYAIDDEILPQRIATGKRTLPQGGERVYTDVDGLYEITTAQSTGNYLVINAPGFSPGRWYSSGPDHPTYRLMNPPKFAPVVLGPVEVTDEVLFLPIRSPWGKSRNPSSSTE
jgi:hypothetical protein